ncbi:MAG: galactose-1-phosphate uridylyltransferase, partial [Oscillibacter sp.]
MVDSAIRQLIAYALRAGLIEPGEETWAVNAVLEVLGLDTYTPPEWTEVNAELPEILKELLDDAVAQGVVEDSVTQRDLLDTALMGRLTPRPAQVVRRFQTLYAQSPQAATNWYYQFSQDSNYIRRDRICRDVHWLAPTDYGDLDITINRSKPEKDPKAIAAARNLPAGGYPQCQLCGENEGYAGRLDHPARGNLR